MGSVIPPVSQCQMAVFSFRMLVFVMAALSAAASADMKASRKLGELDLGQDQSAAVLDETVADLEDGKMEIPKKVPKLLDLIKWDGKVVGAHTYSVTWIDLVKYFTDKSFNAAKTTDTFKEKLGDGNVHVIGWWKMPFFTRYWNEDLVFWPQSLRTQCLTCVKDIVIAPQMGMLYRIAPDYVDGAPNLYGQEYLEAHQIEWIIKRCPTWLSDSCYRPDGFGFTLMTPCPFSLICSTCLGIPPQYCTDL